MVTILVSLLDLRIEGRDNTTADGDTEAASSPAGDHQEADSHHTRTTTLRLMGVLSDAKRLYKAIEGLRRRPSSWDTVDMAAVAIPPSSTSDSSNDGDTGDDQTPSDNQ